MDGTTDDHIAEDQSAQAAPGRTPPYVSFKTFQTLLEELKTNGIPPQIDRSVLSRFAGGLQGQLMSALKALGLMDEANRPTAALPPLVRAYDSPEFKTLLRNMLRDVYGYVFALDLLNATPSMFAKAFSDHSGAKEDVLRKCRTFFLHAAKEAEIPLGPRIENAKFPRPRNTNARKPRLTKAHPDNSKTGDAPPPSDPTISNQAMEYKLVDLMKESDIGDSERSAIWTLIQYLTSKKASSTKTATDQ